MAIKLVIFDLDGTIIDTADAYHSFLNHLLLRWKKPTVDRERFIRELFWKNISVEIEEAAGKEFVEEGMLLYKSDFKNFYSKIKLMKNAERKIQKLKQFFLLAVFTNSYHSAAEGILEHFKLSGHFDSLVGFDDVEKHKPDPEGLLKIIKSLSASPHETVYVGDSPTDMETARAAGCQFIGYGPAEKFTGTKSIQDLYDLCSLVETNPQKRAELK